MSSLGSKQTGVPGLSARAAASHLGRAQHPAPPLLSSRAALGHLGVGRRYADTTGLLHTRWLQLPPVPPPPDFARLRAEAQRLQQRLAAHDSLPVPRPVPFHAPMLTPTQRERLLAEQEQERQRRRAAYAQQLLAEYNRLQAAPYIYEPFRKYLAAGQLSLLKELGAAPAAPAGPDLFMPKSFWLSQNPTGDPYKWSNCANTVYAMLAKAKQPTPAHRYDLVQEHKTSRMMYNFPVRDYYQPVLTARAAEGLHKLDVYMAMHKPVMVGVSHTLNFYLPTKHKNAPTTYKAINDGTIDHFVALVGMGVDNKGKYYRFYDVGTQFEKKGVSKENKLYHDTKTGFYIGKSVATGHTYILTQLRF